MNDNKPRDVAWDDYWGVDAPLAGSAQYVSSDRTEAMPMLLVPDRDAPGGYREHTVGPRSRGRLGF